MELNATAAGYRTHRGIPYDVILLLAGLLVIGFALAADYGMSWDEPDNAVLGQQAVQAYLHLTPPAEWHGNLESKGPFFVATADVLAGVFVRLHPSWLDVDARHFADFLTLPIACLAVLAIAQRVATHKAAVAATLLFATQPIIFGHAFINPKDTPFMAFFLAAVALGLAWIDRIDSGHTKARGWSAVILPAIPPGALLGLATSTRLFGAFAGVLVTCLALVRHKQKALPPLVAYWACALPACYVAWPYLWGDPLNHFWQSLQVMMDFPWGNVVLYRGLLYPAKSLPWHFLPFITLIQLTEPLIVLAIAGAIVALLTSRKDRARIPLLLMLFFWTALPIGTAVLRHSTVYDNSRQFLFALPPLFIATAPAFDWVFRRVRRTWIQALVLLLAIVPGMYWIARLHPYEYIYYNAIVGNVHGAYRKYELDYWGTAYRQAMQIVNQAAPLGAYVEVSGPWESAARFARRDLTVFKMGHPPDAGAHPLFFILSTRSNGDQTLFTGARLLAQVRMENATLAVIRTTWVAAH